MRNILTLIFALTFYNCFGQAELNNLENAYKKKSENLYDQFLQKWFDDCTPITSLDSLNGLHRDVYEIFKDFYKKSFTV